MPTRTTSGASTAAGGQADQEPQNPRPPMMTPSQTRLQAARSAVPMLMVAPRLSRVVRRCSGEMPLPSPSSPLVLAPPSGSSCEDGVSCPSASLECGASVSVGLGAPAGSGSTISPGGGTVVVAPGIGGLPGGSSSCARPESRSLGPSPLTERRPTSSLRTRWRISATPPRSPPSRDRPGPGAASRPRRSAETPGT